MLYLLQPKTRETILDVIKHFTIFVKNQNKSIMLPFILAAAQAIPAIFKGLQGTKQMAEGELGLAGLKRPKYEMPEEVARALTMRQTAFADPYMPGQGVMTDRAEQQAANAYAQSVEAGNPFAAISSIQANSNQALQNIGVSSAQYQAQDANNLVQMLQTVAGYRDQEFQMNEFAPYAQKSQEYRDMIGAGNKNMYGAMDQIAGAIGSMGAGMLAKDAISGMSQQSLSQQQAATDGILKQYGSSDSAAQKDIQGILEDLMGAKVGSTTDNMSVDEVLRKLLEATSGANNGVMMDDVYRRYQQQKG